MRSTRILAERAGVHRRTEPEPAGSALEESNASNLCDARSGCIRPGLRRPDQRPRRGKPAKRPRVVLLYPRREIVPLPPFGRSREPVQLRQRDRRSVVAGEPSARRKMLPPLKIALEAVERDRLDLLARLRQFASPCLLEEAARGPARDASVAAKDTPHEHALLLPLLQPAHDPPRVEVVAGA